VTTTRTDVFGRLSGRVNRRASLELGGSHGNRTAFTPCLAAWATHLLAYALEFKVLLT